MPRGKSSNLKPFEKLLLTMSSGKEFTLEELDSILGNDIYMYRICTYMYHIKINAGGVVKSIRDGRKVVAYQIVNPSEVNKYIAKTGIDKVGFVPGRSQLVPSISKLAELKAKRVVPQNNIVAEETTVAITEEDFTVTEISDTEFTV
jgi:hypothetical protein